MDYDDYIEHLAQQYLDAQEMEKIAEAEYIEKLAENYLEKLALGSETISNALYKRINQHAESKGIATSGLKQYKPSNVAARGLAAAEVGATKKGGLYRRALQRSVKKEGLGATLAGIGAGGNKAMGRNISGSMYSLARKALMKK